MDDSKIKKINETKKIQEQKEAIIAEYDIKTNFNALLYIIPLHRQHPQK